MQKNFSSRVTKNSRQAGFTIVELLIVIVVIAILAALTIVTFGGVRDRAANTRIESQVNAIQKTIEMYKIDNGSLPTTAGRLACIGDPASYPAKDEFIAGQCITWKDEPNNGLNVVSPQFNKILETYAPSLRTDFDIVETRIQKMRGIYYMYSPPTFPTAELQYYKRGNFACQPPFTASYSPTDKFTTCSYRVQPE